MIFDNVRLPVFPYLCTVLLKLMMSCYNSGIHIFSNTLQPLIEGNNYSAPTKYVVYVRRLNDVMALIMLLDMNTHESRINCLYFF